MNVAQNMALGGFPFNEEFSCELFIVLHYPKHKHKGFYWQRKQIGTVLLFLFFLFF